MYCKNCGAQLADGAKFCNQCGVLSGNGDAFCAYCGKEVPIGSAYCQNCGESLNGNEEVILKKFDGENVTPTQARENYESAKAILQPQIEDDSEYIKRRAEELRENYPLKWHRFLVFILVVSGISNFILAIMYMAGEMNGGYNFYNDYDVILVMLNVYYGIFVFGMGIYNLIISKAIRRFKESAPVRFKVMCIISTAGAVLYNFLSALITDAWGMTIFMIINQCVVSVIVIKLHMKYFKTRKELYVF